MGLNPDAKHCGAIETIRTTYWINPSGTAIVYTLRHKYVEVCLVLQDTYRRLS